MSEIRALYGFDNNPDYYRPKLNRVAREGLIGLDALGFAPAEIASPRLRLAVGLVNESIERLRSAARKMPKEPESEPGQWILTMRYRLLEVTTRLNRLEVVLQSLPNWSGSETSQR